MFNHFNPEPPPQFVPAEVDDEEAKDEETTAAGHDREPEPGASTDQVFATF